MARDTGQENETRGVTPLYARCNHCGVKIHVTAYECWKCGKRVSVEVVYASSDPADALYNTRLCDDEKCFDCLKVQNGMKPCRYAFCFRTGKGDCESCGRFQGVRFGCCQDIVRNSGPAEYIGPECITAKTGLKTPAYAVKR